jgi:hypothetical protein
MGTTTEPVTTPQGGDEAASVRGRIERTRADMSRTVDRIEERLSPARLKEQMLGVYHDAKDHVKEDISREIESTKRTVRDATVGRVETMMNGARERVTQAKASVVDTIRENPVPSALIAIGLGWILMNGGGRSRSRIVVRRGGRYEPRGRIERARGAVQDGARQLVERAEGTARDVGEKLEEVGEKVTEAVGEKVSALAQGAEDLVENVREAGSRAIERGEREVGRAEQSLERVFRDNPLALGAVALALGVGLGLALPRTEMEDEWVGEQRDRLLQRAESAAHHALRKAEEKVASVTGTAEPKHDGEAEREHA